METPSDAAFALIRRLSAHFKLHRQFPEKTRLLVELDEHGQDFDQIQQQISGMTIQRDANGVDRVHAGFDAVVQLPEGRELFAPLPSLIAALVTRFSAYPDWADKREAKTVFTFGEIVDVWRGDAEAALLAGVFMKNRAPAGISPSFDAGAKSYSITPGVEVLRYRSAETLDDVLSLHDYRNWTQPAEENRVRFVNVIFNEMCNNGDWPNPIRAAINIKDLGFVPHLVDALNSSRPKIVDQHFGHFASDRVELLLWSVTKLDDAEYWKTRLPKFVRAMYEAWKAAPDAYRPLSTIGESAGLSERDASALALLTEHEPWARYQMRVPNLNQAHWNLKADETIRYLKNCASWEDYVRVRVEKWQTWPDGFGGSEPSAAPESGTNDIQDGESASLPGLHPRLSELAAGLVRDGYWAESISNALKGLHYYVAEKSGLDPTLDSDVLMGRAFTPKSPILRVSEHDNEQRGMMLLFQGAYAGLRNPFAHKLISIEAPSAQEWLGFISALYRLVDAATKTQES